MRWRSLFIGVLRALTKFMVQTSGKKISHGALWSAVAVLVLAASVAFVATSGSGRITGALAGAYEALTPNSVTYSRTATSSDMVPAPEQPHVLHLPTPPVVKAIYMTQCAVGTPSFRKIGRAHV